MSGSATKYEPCNTLQHFPFTSHAIEDATTSTTWYLWFWSRHCKFWRVTCNLWLWCLRLCDFWRSIDAFCTLRDNVHRTPSLIHEFNESYHVHREHTNIFAHSLSTNTYKQTYHIYLTRECACPRPRFSEMRYVCVYMYTYIHLCMLTYLHKHTHTRIPCSSLRMSSPTLFPPIHAWACTCIDSPIASITFCVCFLF